MALRDRTVEKVVALTKHAVQYQATVNGAKVTRVAEVSHIGESESVTEYVTLVFIEFPGVGFAKAEDWNDYRVKQTTFGEAGNITKTEYLLGVFSGPPGGQQFVQGTWRTQDVAAKRTTKSTKCIGEANPSRWRSKLEVPEQARAGDSLTYISTTEYIYDIDPLTGPYVWREITEEREPRISFAGKLGIKSYKGISLGYTDLLVSRVVVTTEPDSSRDISQVTTERYAAIGATQEGAAAGAAVMEAIGKLADADRVEQTLALVELQSRLVFDGIEVRTSVGRGRAETAPDPERQQQEEYNDVNNELDDEYDGGGDLADTGGLDYGVANEYTFDASVGDETVGSISFGAATMLAPADWLEGNISGDELVRTLNRGNAVAAVREYAQTQYELEIGTLYGKTLQMEVENLPTEPLSTVYIEAAGVTGAFRVNGSTWAFTDQGIVAGCDAVLNGGIGRPPE